MRVKNRGKKNLVAGGDIVITGPIVLVFSKKNDSQSAARTLYTDARITGENRCL